MEASYNVEKKMYQTNHQDIMHFNFQKQELQITKKPKDMQSKQNTCLSDKKDRKGITQRVAYIDKEPEEAIICIAVTSKCRKTCYSEFVFFYMTFYMTLCFLLQITRATCVKHPFEIKRCPRTLTF